MTRTVKLVLCFSACAAFVIFIMLGSAVYFGVAFFQGKALFEKGHIALMRGDYAGAIAQLNGALQKPLTPYYRAYAYDNLAFCHGQQGRADEAIRNYTAALKIDSRIVQAHSARGILYEKQRQLNEAFDDYSQAIALDPNAAEALYHRGLIYLWRKQTTEAINDFSEAIRSYPDYSLAYYARGNAYLAAEDIDPAIASYDSALRLSPNFGQGYLQPGHVYVRKKDFDHAIRDFEEAARLLPGRSDIEKIKQRTLRDKLLNSSSIDELTSALVRNPNDAPALLARGTAYFSKHDYPHAITDFTECINKTQSRSAYDHRARTFAKAGDYDKAIADYNEGEQHTGPVTTSIKGLP